MFAEGFAGSVGEESEEEYGPEVGVELDECAGESEAVDESEFEVVARGSGGLVACEVWGWELLGEGLDGGPVVDNVVGGAPA